MVKWTTVLLPLAASAALAASLSAAAAEPLVVDQIDVRLFQHHTGTLSAPVTAGDELWNTILGEGVAVGPSTATVVAVVVSAAPDSYDPDWQVEFVAREKGSGVVLLTQAKPVGVLDADGRYHVGFWIDDTGCTALEVRVRTGQGSPWSEMEIPFACGE